MKKLLIALALTLISAGATVQAEDNKMEEQYNVTFLSSRGECNEEEFSGRDLADSHLLDHIRGAMSFGHKAFAIVKHGEELEFVIVEDNCTEWLTPEQFFGRVNVKNYLGEPGFQNLQLANNR